MSDDHEAGRFRSPPYPGFPLGRAVEFVERLHHQERDHAAPISSAARAWGVSPTSSTPIRIVASLKQFGLVDDEGSGASRKLKITPSGVRVALDKRPGSKLRAEALMNAFLTPKIFDEMYNLWGANLPSDQTVINHFVVERRLSNLAPFSEQSAREILQNYKASYELAIAAAEAILDDDGKSPGVADMQMQTTEREANALPVMNPAGHGDGQLASATSGRGVTAAGERELLAGSLAKGTGFRLLVNGRIGLKEIDRLIRKLEFEKEIYADDDGEDQA